MSHTGGATNAPFDGELTALLTDLLTEIGEYAMRLVDLVELLDTTDDHSRTLRDTALRSALEIGGAIERTADCMTRR